MICSPSPSFLRIKNGGGKDNQELNGRKREKGNFRFFYAFMDKDVSISVYDMVQESVNLD